MNLQPKVRICLAVLSVRLGRVDRVSYNLAEWAKAKAPAKLPTNDGLVRLAGYHRKPVNTDEVRGLNRNKIVLVVVVPSHTDPGRAQEVMMAAAAPDNASTIDCLLWTGPQDRDVGTSTADAQ